MNMATEDSNMAPPQASNAAQANAGGAVPANVALILSELNRQIADSRESRHQSPGILRFPKLLLGVALMAATAIPWLSSLRGAAAVMRVAGAKAAGTKTEGAKAAGAKTSSAQTAGATTAGKPAAGAKDASPDLAGLVLNATCITREQRIAIINGRVYKQKDTIAAPNAADSRYVLVDILPHKVVLECRGKRLPLCYANTVTTPPGTKRVGDPVDKDTLPPELSDLAGDPEMNRLLEKVQQGVGGLEKVLTVLSDGK
jgi:hypothetical protein